MISGKAPYFDFKAAYRILEGAILSEKKPNPKVIDDVEQNLKSAEELSIFNTLKKLMESCWSEPSYRPNSKAGWGTCCCNVCEILECAIQK